MNGKTEDKVLLLATVAFGIAVGNSISLESDLSYNQCELELNRSTYYRLLSRKFLE